MLRKARHITLSFLGLQKTTSPKFQRKSKAGSLEKPFQELSRTESRNFGALSKRDEFRLNPQVRKCSARVPVTSRNNDFQNQETSGDRSQSDRYLEVELSVRQASSSADSDQEETSHKETGVQQEIPYCSTGTSSRKQRKARSTSQPQFRSENNPAIIETDQLLLTVQKLASNSISTTLNNNLRKISKLPKSLTTTMPTFDGKSQKFELFEDLFQTSLKLTISSQKKTR